MIEFLDLALDLATAGLEVALLVRAAWPRLASLLRWSAVTVVGYAGLAGDVVELTRARARRRRCDRQLLAQLHRRSP